MQLQCTYSTTGNNAVALGGPVNAGDALTMFPQGVCFLPLGAILFVDLHLMVIQRQCKTCGWSRSFVHMLMKAAADRGNRPRKSQESRFLCAVALYAKPVTAHNIIWLQSYCMQCMWKGQGCSCIMHCGSQSQHRPTVSLGLHNCPSCTALPFKFTTHIPMYTSFITTNMSPIAIRAGWEDKLCVKVLVKVYLHCKMPVPCMHL